MLTQAETLDELNHNLREVIGMILEDGEPELETEFIGTQSVWLRWGSIPREVVVKLKVGFL